MESKPQTARFTRSFLDTNLTVTGWDDLEPYYQILDKTTTDSVDQLTAWLVQYSELKSVTDEFCTRRYIEMTCHTDDEKKKNDYLYCVRVMEPEITKWEDKLNRKFAASPAADFLDPETYGRLARVINESVALFDEKNIPLNITLQELSQEYQGIMGSMTVTFEGEEKTMPMMSLYMLDQNRDKREKAFLATVERRLADREKLEKIFDKMLIDRAKWAANLGLNDYREYCFRSKLRDYTPKDCRVFHDAIEKAVVPLARKLAENRKSKMGLAALAPWDMACDPLGRPPLKPFTKTEQLYTGVKKIFTLVDERLGEMFGAIKSSMDIDSRKGKAPGGYQATLAEARIPFIFTNAVGTQDDVNTLLHEGGHAFHTLRSRGQSLIWYRHAAMEFSEVASMTMELIGGERLEPFYDNKEDRARARLDRMEMIINLFTWVAHVDAFQHWIYTNPGHSRADRAERWVALSERFSSGVDWSLAPPDALKYQWHRQLHIFELPFYYIEYAIAQLGALQIYKRYKKNPEQGIADYLTALSLGGSAAPERLFESAGINFDFSSDTLVGLMEFVQREITL